MPNKTIYIKDADVPTWDRAQRELQSVSSLFVDYLKERLEMETLRKKAKKAGRIDEVQAMNELIATINADLNLDIELDPFWTYPILDQNTINHGYKLHRKRADPDRVMSVVISPLDVDNSGRLNTTTHRRIQMEIQNFWNGKTTEMHRFVDATR